MRCLILALLILALVPPSFPQPSAPPPASYADMVDAVFGKKLPSGLPADSAASTESNPIQTSHVSSSSSQNYLAGFQRNPDGSMSQITVQLPDEDNLPIEWKKQIAIAEDQVAQKLYYQAVATYQHIFESSSLYGRMNEQHRYDLHLAYGRALVMTGDTKNSVHATMAFEQALTLTNKPRDAFFNLGELKVRRGDVKGALNDFKNSLYHSPESVEALQAVGVLYIILGDLSTGRHYLRRALQIWEGQGENLIREMQAKGEDALQAELYHWLLDYLLSAFELNSQWRVGPVNSATHSTVTYTSRQTPHDFAMLSYFVNEQESFVPRMHYDFGMELFNLGVWEMARMHMDTYGVQRSRSKDDPFVSVMRLRVALDFPHVIEGRDQIDDLWSAMGTKFASFLEGHDAPTPPVEELQDAAETLGLLHYHHEVAGGSVTYSDRLNTLKNINGVLRKGCSYLDRVSPHLLNPPPPSSRIRIGIVSQFFCSHPVGRVTLPLVSSLPRDKFRVHVFAFPTIVDSWAQAISWSADSYTSIPMDFQVASERIAAAKLDILLFPDHSDTISTLLSYQRLAPVMASYYVRGAVEDSGLSAMDYYLFPSILNTPLTETERGGVQLVQLEGFGLPFDPPHDFNPDRQNVEIKGRKFFANENLYLITSSIPSSVHVVFDDVVRGIVEADEDAVVLLVPDGAEVKLAAPTSSEVSAKLGPQQWHWRLMERIRRGLDEKMAGKVMLMDPLSVDERMDLLALATCVLDTGGGITLLESFALKVPVVGVCGRGEGRRKWEELGCAVNTLIGGEVERLSVAGSLEELARTAVNLGKDETARRVVVEGIKRAIDDRRLESVFQELGSLSGGDDVAKFLERVARV
jgi:predicted O-linked N-acetylglucosamine transferase (SPINDLY family)